MAIEYLGWTVSILSALLANNYLLLNGVSFWNWGFYIILLVDFPAVYYGIV